MQPTGGGVASFFFFLFFFGVFLTLSRLTSPTSCRHKETDTGAFSLSTHQTFKVTVTEKRRHPDRNNVNVDVAQITRRSTDIWRVRVKTVLCYSEHIQ